jgi:hypothetical protein
VNLTVIQQILAPVVMISACGMLCLGLYNRLTAIVSRIRQFNRERLEHAIRQRDVGDTVRRTLALHSDVLERQVPRMLGRARLIHRALMCLVGSVLCMLASSLTIGGAMLLPALFPVAVGCFVCGMVGMFVGMAIALRELSVSLGEVELEAQALEDLPLATRDSAEQAP